MPIMAFAPGRYPQALASAPARQRSRSRIIGPWSGLPALIVPPERRPPLHRIEQPPIPLLHHMPLGERRARLVPQRPQDAVVAVVGREHHPPERRGRGAAGGVPVVDQRLAPLAVERGEGPARALVDLGQGGADQRQVTADRADNVGEDGRVVRAGQISTYLGGKHHFSDYPQSILSVQKAHDAHQLLRWLLERREYGRRSRKDTRNCN